MKAVLSHFTRRQHLLELADTYVSSTKRGAELCNISHMLEAIRENRSSSESRSCRRKARHHVPHDIEDIALRVLSSGRRHVAPGGRRDPAYELSDASKSTSFQWTDTRGYRDIRCKPVDVAASLSIRGPARMRTSRANNSSNNTYRACSYRLYTSCTYFEAPHKRGRRSQAPEIERALALPQKQAFRRCQQTATATPEIPCLVCILRCQEGGRAPPI